MMKVLIAGATGLIGNHLLNSLIHDKNFTDITILLRKEIKIPHSKVRQIIFDYTNELEYKKLEKYEAIFCCLGTTIKKAKSKENFLQVDVEYPKKLATLVKTKQFLIVSSMGANENSYMLYPKAKGQIENFLKKQNIESLHIFRPSQLEGNRKEFRLGEQISDKIMRLFDIFIPKNYKLIQAKTVAEAMKIKSLSNQKGNFTHLSGEITQIVQNEI